MLFVVELLSPVGNKEMLYQAIHNGADAVYLGGKSFGARAYSQNFNNDEMIEAINYCHLYGVKIYVTVNTIIFENEVNDCLDYIYFLYKNGVDAVIMQDIGMIDLVHKKFPNLEIHASTQCHNHNKEGIDFLKKLGVTRIVLDREMSLEDINSLDISLEKEIFIHGALCISYSGCCLFSSLNGGRSGNRGSCVGSCRLPYKLMKNNELLDTSGRFLLSTKELNTTKNLISILNSDIASLKIEGRMKSPYYVGYVTKLYRQLIDKYYNKEPMIISDEEETNLKKLFNRKFTSGYLFNDYIINSKSPNHLGIEVGKVIKVDDKKIAIKLTEDINLEDGIRFKKNNLGMIINKMYNDKGLLVSNVKKGNILYLDNKINLKTTDIVLKTIDVKLNNQLNNYSEKKIKITYNVKAQINQKLLITMSDGENTVSSYGNIVDKALNKKVTEEVITEKLAKLGDSPFILEKISFDIDDNIFISLSEINNIRRVLTKKLIEKRIEIKKDIIVNEIKEKKGKTKNNKISINYLVRNEQQLKILIDNKADNIYVSNYDLYLKYKELGNIYYKLPRANLKLKDFNNEKLVVTELGGIFKYPNKNETISEYYLNIVNNNSIKLLKENNIKRIVISPEVDINSLNELDTSNLEIVVYGKIEAMAMKYPLLDDNIGKTNYHDKYYLVDRFNNKYRILKEDGISKIIDYKNVDLIDRIDYFKQIGITNYKIDLLDETEEEIKRIIKRINNKVNC